MGSFKQGTTLGTITVSDKDPTIAPGVPGTPNMLLVRTDTENLYYFQGPLDTDWKKTGNGGLAPPFPVPLINTTIFVNDGGNDNSGKGTFAKPYKTLDRARRDIPNPYPPGNRYFIDATGLNEVLTPGYRLPAFKGPVLIDLDMLSPYFIYMAGVNISSAPRLTTLLSAADATVGFADIVSQVVDPITAKMTITIFPPRPTWAGNALKGKQAEGTAGGHDNGMIYESEPTYIKVMWPFPLTAGPAITITEPSAYFTGTDTDFWGCLVAQNSDSIAFRNVNVKDQFGGYGLGMQGPDMSVAIRCELESADFERLSGITSRYGKNWFTGFPFFSGPTFTPHCLFDQCVGFPTIFTGPTVPDIVGCVFDGCDPIDFKYFTPGVGFGAFDDAICSVPAMNISTTIIRNGIGDGVRFHGTCGVIENCDIYNNAGDGVNVGLGAGTLQIKNCLSSGPPNAGFGVRGTDGLQIKVDAATSGAPLPLTGVGGDMKIGDGAPRSWADFVSGASGRPALNELDLKVVAGVGGTAADAALAPAYVTGTGTRLYQ